MPEALFVTIGGDADHHVDNAKKGSIYSPWWNALHVKVWERDIDPLVLLAAIEQVMALCVPRVQARKVW